MCQPVSRPAALARRISAGVTLAFVAATASPAAAQADATITRSGLNITITAGDGNDTILGDASRGGLTQVRFKNTTGALTPGAGCRRQPRGWISCGDRARSTQDILRVRATLGAGNDRFKPVDDVDRLPRAIVDGGPGDDVISGTTLPDELLGGDGNDEIVGGDDADRIDGGAGTDRLFGGRGGDTVAGGPGVDDVFGDDTINGDDPGNWGIDVLDLRDGGADRFVHCGYGQDAAVVDASDPTDSCEVLTGAVTRPATDLVGTLPMALTVGPVQGTNVPLLANGTPLMFAVKISAPAFTDALLEISRSEARRIGLGRKAIVIGAGTGAPFSPVPVEYAGQMRLNWSVRPKLARIIAADRRLRINATLTVVATDANMGKTTTRRELTLHA